jgi:hypothetical protein
VADPRPSAADPDGAAPDGRGDPGTAALLAKLAGIPHAVRAFDLSAREAAARYRVNPGALSLLEAHGLADHRDGQAYFDINDLINVEFRLGGGPLTASLQRCWPAILKRLPEPDPVTFDIGLNAMCPSPGHPGDCHFTVRLPDGRGYEVRSPPGHREPLVWLRAERPTCWPELPPAAREIIDELREITFVQLPGAAVWDDVAFVRRTGLADCAVFSRLLVANGSRRGVPMRQSFGLMVAPPLALPHCWAEVGVDGVWVPVDPLLIKALVSWHALDAASWHPHRSPGATFYRLAAGYSPILGTHQGDRVELSYLAKRVR